MRVQGVAIRRSGYCDLTVAATDGKPKPVRRIRTNHGLNRTLRKM